MVAAAKAFCMKSYSSIAAGRSFAAMRVSGVIFMAMHVAFHVVAAGHDENPAFQADDVDLGSVEPRQHRSRDHLGDGTERRLPASQIKHAIERSQQRVQLVRAEQNGDPKL